MHKRPVLGPCVNLGGWVYSCTCMHDMCIPCQMQNWHPPLHCRTFLQLRGCANPSTPSNFGLDQSFCRMAVAFRPLQPCLSLLLHRSASSTRHACLRARFVHVPIRGKIKRPFQADSDTFRAARCCSHQSVSNASRGSGTEQVLGLARQAVPQTFAPHSVVWAPTFTIRRSRHVVIYEDKLQCLCCACRLT